MRILSLISLLALAPVMITPAGAASQESVSTINPVGIEAHREAWPEGASFVESEKGLPIDVSTPRFDKGGIDASGYRILSLVLQPGEKIKFRMNSEEEKVALKAYIPKPPPEFTWRMDLRTANNRTRGLSKQRMEVQNTTTAPQTLALILYGRHGYKYRVDMERIPASK